VVFGVFEYRRRTTSATAIDVLSSCYRCVRLSRPFSIRRTKSRVRGSIAVERSLGASFSPKTAYNYVPGAVQAKRDGEPLVG